MNTSRGIKQLLAAVLVVGFSATLLSGCSTENAAEPAQTQTPAPTEKAISPTPTDSQQPAVPEMELEMPSTWLISADGIGPVPYGGDIADVRPSMGAFAEIPSEWCGVARFRSEDKGLAMLAMLGEDASTIEGMFVSGWNQSDAAASNSPRTAEGIGIGASLSELLSAYPAITLSRERADEVPTFYYSFQNANGSWLVFTVYEDTVGAIAVHNEPWLQGEYCA